jgi:hypothetical protein
MRIRAEVRAESRAEFEAKLAEQERAFEAKIAAMAERLAATAGEMPQVKNWKPQMVCYRGQLFACDGALWQARQDTATARAPGVADWACIARAGSNGKDCASVSVRGEWTATDSYGPLDIVTRNGHAYICARANPGVPGQCDDWMLLASRGPHGQTGKAGPMGPQGKTGERGEQIHHWELDPERYRAIPVLSTGEIGPSLELRPLFALYQTQTSE